MECKIFRILLKQVSDHLLIISTFSSCMIVPLKSFNQDEQARFSNKTIRIPIQKKKSSLLQDNIKQVRQKSIRNLKKKDRTSLKSSYINLSYSNSILKTFELLWIDFQDELTIFFFLGSSYYIRKLSTDSGNWFQELNDNELKLGDKPLPVSK